MIITIVLMIVSFVVVLFELGSVIAVFRTCKNIKCVVSSSKKVCAREDGYLVKEYWKTDVSFALDGEDRMASLETSTFCQTGQVLGCYYYPKKNLVFRKRDIRRVLRSRSIPAFSAGLLFLVLELLFRLTGLGGIIIGHAFEAVGIVLVLVFAAFGMSFAGYSINAFRHTRESRVTSIDAEVIDVIRKTKRNRETERFFYYPVYKYTLGGFEHTVNSRLARELPPKKGSTESVLADTKKGGLVEYKDMRSSFVLGICFLIIAWMILYVVAFM